jgi:CRISPR/Cas system CSM-associated protein Csm2 small subunit
MRKAMIEELMTTLKIPQGNFNYATIEDEIRHIPGTQLKDFYKAVMSAESFGNGMKSIMQAAEKFKPVVIDYTEEKAKELVALVEAINAKIGEDAKNMGVDFVKLANSVILPTAGVENLKILDNVKPYYSYKSLIINIRHYQTSIDAINAFKTAIEYAESRSFVVATQANQSVIGLPESQRIWA